MNVSKLSSSAGSGLDLLLVLGGDVASVERARFRPKNRLLAALPRDVLADLLPYLKPEYLPRGKVLCDVGVPLRHVYFLEAGVVSLVTVFGNGATMEMATVGREGLIGIGSVLGGDRALARYLVPMPGVALAIEASRFRSALREGPELRATCEAYAQAFLRDALQTAACNSVHMVEERFARRLLTSHDRSDGDALALTQEYLAEMLGVCRSTVTLAAGVLQKAGIIRYRRGAVRVLDRLGLERASCECYRVIRDQYERLLPRTYERGCERKASCVGEPH
jgi:CRP-like cAMP-binding protein